MKDIQSLLVKMKKSYQLSIFFIIILLTLSFFTLNIYIHQQKSDAALINIAGKQRMLSQKITRYVLMYEKNWLAKFDTLPIAQDLTATANLMLNNHLFLMNSNDDLSAKTRELYFQSSPSLHHRIESFSKHVNIFLKHKEISNIQYSLNTIFSTNNVDTLLKDLDHIVSIMEKESITNLSNIEKAVFYLWLFTLISIIAFTIYSFKRTSSLTRKSFNKLKKEKSHIAEFEFAINMHSIIFRVDLTHKIRYVNEKFCHFYGYSQSEILGQHQAILGSKEHPKSLFDEMHAFISRGEVWQHELRNVDKNGRLYWLDTTVVPINENHRIASYMVVQNDITEQKQMGIVLGKVHSVIASSTMLLSEKINQLLHIGVDTFQLPFAIVSEVSGDTYKILYAQSPDDALEIGASFNINNTYCIHTYQANKPTAFHHVAESKIRYHPCYREFALESYIGCPIFVDGKRFGTINFSSSSAKTIPFSSLELDIIQLIAQWIGYEMMKENHHSQMVSQRNLMVQMSKQARIGAWEVDLISNHVIWSDMTKEIHEVPDDYQPDMATAINFYKAGESRDKITQLVELASADGTPYQTELELVTAKGNEVWISTYGNAVFENGRCIKLYGSFQDIADKKSAEKEIQNKNRRMDLAAESAGIGVWEYNIATNHLTWDEWMFQLYGVEPADFSCAYEAWEKGVHPEDIEQASYELALAIEGKKKFDTQFRIIRPDGLIKYIKAAALVLRNEQGTAQTMIGVNYDVTERVENEQALIEAKELAEQASNVKNEFLASMSHEIRTPMNGVVGMLDLLSDTPLNSEQKHRIAVAKNSADSLLFLINDILDFSKIDANKLELEQMTFDLHLLLAEFVDSMSQQAHQKGLELILDTVDITESLVIGDPNRIRQILTNLVSNAIKFTEIGEVVIKVALKQEADNEQTWRLVIQIQDTGIGIAKDKQASLFDSFKQVDSSTTRKFGGTGLGLAIVKKLCLCMYGDVELISDIGKGSLFVCNIQVGKTEQVIPKLPQLDISQLSILVVDDNETNREVLSKQLAKWQVKVTCVESANIALSLCQRMVENNPHDLFDIAILDMQMPHMDGAELGEVFRADHRFDEMKLVMMTSMHMQGDAKFFADLGFSAYFPKPATSSDLFNALNIMTEEGDALNYASPLITQQYIKVLHHQNKQRLISESKSLFNWPKNTKILLVEDNRVNQMVAKGVLDHLSIPCEIATNGQDALTKIIQSYDKQQKTTFSLILMDCQMPIMDGYEATAKIRQGELGQINSHIPIIAMTANAMQGDKEKCLNVGMNDYLAKPIDKNLVFEKLTHWLNK